MTEIRRTVAPTVALAAFSAAIAAGFVRLVDGHGWVLLVLVAAVLPHGIGLATRSRTPALQAGLWLGGLALYVVWAVVPGATSGGLPTADTLHAVGDRIETGLRILRDQDAPVPDRPGVVLLVVVAVWVMACAADTLAFRRWASVGALAPGITIFIWTAALAPDADEATRAAASVAVTAAAFLALQHQVLQTRRRPAVGTEHSVPAPRQIGGGIALAVVAALVAVLLAPSLPGAGADPLVDLRDDDLGSSTYQTSIPPLVSVADDLRRGEQVELFTVAADRPEYWRTVALDEYATTAGGQWTLKAEGGDIERGLDDAVPRSALRQQYRIGGLTERWMPAAFLPVSVSRSDTLVVTDSRTLVTGEDSVSGISYTVFSEAAADDATAAQAAETGNVPTDLEQFAELPASVPTEVRDLAAEVTASATTPYAQATLLRDFFRGGTFTYDAEVDLTDTEQSTVEFLQQRRGFCVQFASTYALMARSLGIPARVAVGFTPGAQDPATGRYVVTNYEAHAWPEVWLPGIGWTNRFEPTPPSGEPGGSDLPGDSAEDAVVPPVTAPPPTTVVPAPVPDPAEPVAPETGGGTPTPSGVGDEGSGGLPRWLAVLAVLVVIGGVAGAAVPVAKARRRAARRRRADPAERVAGAWEEAVDRLRELGAPRPVATTPSEVAAGAEPLVGADAAGALALLADAHTDAQFREVAVSDAEADVAWDELAQFDGALARRLDRRTRIRARMTLLRDRNDRNDRNDRSDRSDASHRTQVGV